MLLLVLNVQEPERTIQNVKFNPECIMLCAQGPYNALGNKLINSEELVKRN